MFARTIRKHTATGRFRGLDLSYASLPGASLRSAPGFMLPSAPRTHIPQCSLFGSVHEFGGIENRVQLILMFGEIVSGAGQHHINVLNLSRVFAVTNPLQTAQ